MNRPWLFAPLAAGIALFVLARLGIWIAGAYDRGDALYIGVGISMTLVAIGAAMVLLYGLVRFIVWAARS